MPCSDYVFIEGISLEYYYSILLVCFSFKTLREFSSQAALLTSLINYLLFYYFEEKLRFKSMQDKCLLWCSCF